MRYLFKHVLMRDAIYNMQFRHQLRELHYKAAKAIEESYAADLAPYYADLGYHYDKAELPDLSTFYLVQAGRWSLEKNAYLEARYFFKRVLDLLPPDDSMRLPLHLRLGESSHWLGEYVVAQQYLLAALEMARRQDHKGYLADALYWLGQAAIHTGDYAQARSYLEESLELARVSGSKIILVRALYGLGDLFWRLGFPDQALVHCQESLALARQLGNVTQELYALNRLGSLARDQGDFDKAQQLWEETLARAIQAGNRERATSALNNLGVVANDRGDIAQALAYHQQALPIVWEMGKQQTYTLLLNNIAEEHLRLGNLNAAQHHIYEGLSLARSIRAIPLMLGSVQRAGWLLCKRGNLAQGLALWGMVLRHPSFYNDLKKDMQVALAELGLDSADPQVTAGLDKGQALDLETVVAELLAELSQPETAQPPQI